MKYLVFIGTVFAVSCGLTALLRAYANKVRLFDIPNERSSHTVPTPRGGGLAIVITFLAGITVLWMSGVVSSSTVAVFVPAGLLVAIVGFLDDHRHLPARIRLSVHAIAAAGCMYFLPDLPTLPLFQVQFIFSPWSYGIVLLALIWSINLHNFMDGIDGIAAVETMCVCGCAALIVLLNGGNVSYAWLLFLIVVSTAGFLVWNWPPAKIFMGDACSGFLGLYIGIFALVTSIDGSINLWSWFILYGVFLVDATCTLFTRILSGQRFFEAHRSHTYQILSRRVNSHKKVTIGVLLVNIFWLFPFAVVSSRYPVYAVLCTLIAFMPIVALALRSGAGKLNQ